MSGWNSLVPYNTPPGWNPIPGQGNIYTPDEWVSRTDNPNFMDGGPTNIAKKEASVDKRPWLLNRTITALGQWLGGVLPKSKADMNAGPYFANRTAIFPGLNMDTRTLNGYTIVKLFGYDASLDLNFTIAWNFPAGWKLDTQKNTWYPDIGNDPYDDPYKARYQAEGKNVSDTDKFYQVVKVGDRFQWAGTDSGGFMNAEKPLSYQGNFDSSKSSGTEVTERLFFNGSGSKKYLDKFNSNDFTVYAAMPIGKANDPAYLNEAETVWKFGYKRLKDDVYLNRPYVIHTPDKAKSTDLDWFHTINPPSTDINHGQLNPILPPYAVPLTIPFKTENIIQKANLAPWVQPGTQLWNVANPNVTPDNRVWDWLKWYGYTDKVLTGLVALNVAGAASSFEYSNPLLLAVGPVLSSVPFLYNYTAWTVVPFVQWVNEWFWRDLPYEESWAERQAKIYAAAVTDATVTACVVGGVTVVGGFITGTAFYVISLIPGVNIYALPVLILGSLVTFGLDMVILAGGGAAIWWDAKANGGNGLPSFGDIFNKIL